MVIEEFRLALYSLLGGYTGAIFSLYIFGRINAITSFVSILFVILFVVLLSLLIQSYKKENKEQENMIELLKDMLKGVPSWYYPHEHLKKFILTEDGINQLVKMEIIKNDGKKPNYPYYITPIGMQLISVWESIKLNKKLNWLTAILIILGILNLIFLLLL